MSSPEHVVKLLTPTTREKTMNTIQLVNSNGDTVTYTDSELTTIIKNGVSSAEDSVRLSDELRKIRNEVRDFFGEGEWSGGEQTVNKGDVNFLLERIGARKITSNYVGSAVINFTFTVEAEDEDEARSIIEEGTSVSSYGYDLQDESCEVDEIDLED